MLIAETRLWSSPVLAVCMWFSGILYPALARPMQKLAENSRLKCLAVVTSPAMLLLAPTPHLLGSDLRRIIEGAHIDFARIFSFALS